MIPEYELCDPILRNTQLGITTNIESYIEPFIKCLKLNDIEIQKGDFEHILMSKKNAKKDLGTGV